MFDLHVSRVGSGPAIIASHGVGSTGAVWDSMSAVLSKNYLFIAWDQPGHGKSPQLADATGYTATTPYDALVQVVEETRATTGQQKVILLGHSLGGYVSARYAIDHPDRVGALILISTGPGFRSPDAREKWNADIIKQSQRKDRPEMLVGLHADSYVIDHLGDISCPTLAMVGTEDAAFVGATEYIEKKVPGAQRVTLDGVGHMAPKTNGEEMANIASTFLASREL